MKRSVALTIFLFLLSACGKREEAPPPVPPPPPQAAPEPAPAPAPALAISAPVATASVPSTSVETAKPAPDTYVVVKGDTLYGVAKKHGVNHRDLARWNDIVDARRLQVGRELRLRAPGS